MKLIDETGNKYGKWTVIRRSDRDPGKKFKTYWLCRCECGAEKSIEATSLRTKDTNSCRSCSLTTHGLSRSPEYHIWRDIIQRCRNKREPGYSRYGGRGIDVCDEWFNSFEAFIDHIGLRPDSRFEIDRIDNDKGYFPGNVRWVPSKVNNRNKSNNRLLTYNGETKCLAEWSEIVGIDYSCLSARLGRGWSTEKTLTTPVKRIVLGVE